MQCGFGGRLPRRDGSEFWLNQAWAVNRRDFAPFPPFWVAGRAVVWSSGYVSFSVDVVILVCTVFVVSFSYEASLLTLRATAAIYRDMHFGP